MEIEQAIFEIAEALRLPVLTLTVAALAYTVAEAGSLIAELVRRRRRRRGLVESAVVDTRARLSAGDRFGAAVAAQRIAWSKSMSRTLAELVEQIGDPEEQARVAKLLADFDYSCIRRLERTRILVRLGPALGLMGTLIPLSPALAGLARGDVLTLTDNLRVAFSITVTGLLIGAVAFTISLIRDRLYGQDFTDAEYLANAILGTAVPAARPAADRPALGPVLAEPVFSPRPPLESDRQPA